MDKELQGRIAWVTGSSRGIGRRIAERLAEAGCDMAISGQVIRVDGGEQLSPC